MVAPVGWAAETEEACKIVIHGFSKILEDIDACVTSHESEIPTSIIRIIIMRIIQLTDLIA